MLDHMLLSHPRRIGHLCTILPICIRPAWTELDFRLSSLPQRWRWKFNHGRIITNHHLHHYDNKRTRYCPLLIPECVRPPLRLSRVGIYSETDQQRTGGAGSQRRNERWMLSDHVGVSELGTREGWVDRGVYYT